MIIDMKLYIVRHGETDMNVAKIPQGWIDTELNNNGVQQAIKVAENFDAQLDAIFTSDLKRATRTAQEFRQKYKNIPYIEDTRLRVRDFGDAAGVDRDTYDLEKFWSIADMHTIPHSEILKDFKARIADFLVELKTRSYQSVLIVTHGNVMNEIQTIIDPNFESRPHSNNEITEVEFNTF